MRGISRSAGETESEKYLADLADRTFLNLWNYPNVFREQKQGGKGDGKELCDLLVVCGDDVIIFSDKTIQWTSHADPAVCWKRWYREAIAKSVAQIRGAERWLREFPDKIFLDKQCTERLPIELPPISRRRVHGVVIALGAVEACKTFYNDPDGSLIISSMPGDMLFAVGDVDPGGPFVHVFDRPACEVVFDLLDTVTDFTNYLRARAEAIRSGLIMSCHGEQDLLAFYLKRVGKDGEHGFVQENGKPFPPGSSVVIDGSLFEDFVTRPEFERRREADKVSYNWDTLINVFTKTIIDGTAIHPFRREHAPDDVEPALREMAREPRTYRRLLGQGIIDAYNTVIETKAPQFARAMLPGKGAASGRCGYVILVLAFTPDYDEQGGYNYYRKVRAMFLTDYCNILLLDYPELDIVVGIGVDAPPQVTGRKGGSEDLVGIHRHPFTEDEIAKLRARQQEFRILIGHKQNTRSQRVDEYPREPRGREGAGPRSNRAKKQLADKQRRAAMRGRP